MLLSFNGELIVALERPFDAPSPLAYGSLHTYARTHPRTHALALIHIHTHTQK